MKIQNILTKFILSRSFRTSFCQTVVWSGPYTNRGTNIQRTFRSSAALGVPNVRHPLIWRVDWLLVQSGSYAIVDPESPSSILYVTKKEYLKLIGIAESNDFKLVLLASPNDAKPKDEAIEAPKPENSPPVKTVGVASFWKGMLSRISRSYRAFYSTKSKMFEARKVPRYLNGLVKRWSLSLGQWAGLPLTPRGWYLDLNQAVPYLLHIVNTQGTAGLVLLLKNSMLFIQQHLAGTPKSSHTYGHPVSLSNGYPRWIPSHARTAMRQGSKRVIRFWLSICYIYKVIEVPHKISTALEGITTPAFVPGLIAEQLQESYRQFLRTVFIPKVLKGPIKWPELKKHRFFTPVSAGPNGTPAINHVGLDAAALLVQHRQVMKTKKGKSILGLVVYIMAMFGCYIQRDWLIKVGEPYLKRWDNQMLEATVPKEEPKPLRHSRVHILGEPGGKLRPVAILDIFTQRALKPLHDAIFKVLKGIPQDGTHSQVRLMSWLKEHAGLDWLGKTWSSLDISKATDSIPTLLYKILLEEVFGNEEGPTPRSEEMAEAVIDIMVQRDFNVTVDSSVNCSREEANKLPSRVRYSRGQPMGCLGSFALLALWNHSWVQFASWLVTGKVLYSYGVTGDDVVIAEPRSDSPIGQKYVEISELFGIQISSPKSYISSTLFNFLSRTWVAGEEVSPASLREDIHIRDTSTRTQRALRLAERDWWNFDGNGWLAKAMKYFLYPSELLISMTHVRKGKLDGYGLRSVLAFLSPSRSIAAAVGLSGVPVFGWLSAFAGSTVLLAHGNKVRNDSILPRGPIATSHSLIRDLLCSVLQQIIDIYEWNRHSYGYYKRWYDAQNHALRHPLITALFLPSEIEFHALYSRWLSPDTIEGYTNKELVSRLGDEWWHHDNMRLALLNALNWLESLQKCQDFSDPELFSHLASIAYATRAVGEREFNARERFMLSTLFLLSSCYPDLANISISAKMTDYLEKKFLSRFLGYQV